MRNIKVVMEINVKVTDEDIEDIIVTAIEGGIGYWCCLDNTGDEYENAPEDEPVSITATKILLNGGKLKLIDEYDDNKRYEMDLDDLIYGIETWKKYGYDHYSAITADGIDCGFIDAECADAIIQFAIFSTCQYG